MLALGLCFALQLDSPVWAWLTVYIVAQPTPGMLLSKSLYRFVGTIAGAALGVLLIAAFAQMPQMFIFALAVVVGGCTVLSHLLTNFRAYATVLAAYTAAIVACDAIDDPNQVFFIAMARGSCILIGIACSVAITYVFAPHHAAEQISRRFVEVIKLAARRAAFSWQGDPAERLRLGKGLIDEIIALDTEIDFAAAESPSFRRQVNRARSLLANLFGIISARRSLDAHLERRGWPTHHALGIYHGVVLDFLRDLPSRLDRGEWDELEAEINDITGELSRLRVEEDSVDGAEVVSERLVIDRMQDLLARMGAALEDWSSVVRGRRANAPRLVLNFHRDHRAARIHGLRAFLAVAVTGAFWIGTAWPHGPGALIFVAIMLSLFSSLPRPDQFGWRFLYASVPGIFAGLALKFWVLAGGSGYGYLMAASSLFLIPLGLCMAHPKAAQYAIPFSLVFLNVAAPANPMNYDLSDSINNALAIEVGVLFGTLAYLLILPPDPVAARRYVTFRIRRGLQRLAELPRTPRFCAWETRMYDRVHRLHDPQNLSGSNTDEWLEAGLGALTLGNEIIRLRHLYESRELAAQVHPEVVQSAGRLSSISSPSRCGPLPRWTKSGSRLQSADPGRGQAGRETWARAVGGLEEMGWYLQRHALLSNLERAA